MFPLVPVTFDIVPTSTVDEGEVEIERSKVAFDTTMSSDTPVVLVVQLAKVAAVVLRL